MWATTAGGVVRVDPATGKQLSVIPFSDPCYLTVTDTTAFVSSCGGGSFAGSGHDGLLALDAVTGQVLFRTTIMNWGPVRVDGNTLLMVQSDLANSGFLRIVQMNAATGKVSGAPFEIALGEPRFTLPLSGIRPFFDVGEGSAWITDFWSGEVIRVGLPISGEGMPTPSHPPTSSPSPSTSSPIPSPQMITAPAVGPPGVTATDEWRGTGGHGVSVRTWAGSTTANSDQGEIVIYTSTLYSGRQVHTKDMYDWPNLDGALTITSVSGHDVFLRAADETEDPIGVALATREGDRPISHILLGDPPGSRGSASDALGGVRVGGQPSAVKDSGYS